MDTACPPAPVPVALVHPVPTIVANGPACLPAPAVTPPPPVSAPPSSLTDAEEVLVDCQSILFNENPFVLANKRRQRGGISLGGPPTGYGSSGVLKTTVYSKKASGSVCVLFCTCVVLPTCELALSYGQRWQPLVSRRQARYCLFAA